MRTPTCYTIWFCWFDWSKSDGLLSILFWQCVHFASWGCVTLSFIRTIDPTAQSALLLDYITVEKESHSVFLSLWPSELIQTMMIHNTQAAVHFKHKSDPDRCIWLSSNIWNHETFLSSYITHRTPGSHRLIALLPTCLWRDGSPLLFYSFLSLHPKRLCHLSLSHLPFEMNYITSSVNNLWMCAVA